MLSYKGRLYFSVVFILVAFGVSLQGAPIVAFNNQYQDSTKQVVEELSQVIFTATRTKRALKDVPVVTRLITEEEIRNEAPKSITDLLETELPGIEFTMTEGVSNSISFMGLGANYLLILVDGERMAGETQRSNPDFNRIDIDNVERIEIVKGAMSTLYGSGAVAGVINIITKSARKPLEAGLEAMYDTEGEGRAGLNIGVKKGSLASYTSAVANIKDKYFIQDTEIEGYKNLSISEKLTYAVNDNFTLGLRGSYYSHTRHNAGLTGTLLNDLYKDYNLLFTSRYNLLNNSNIEFSYNYDNYSKYAKYLKLNEKERTYRDVIHNPKVIFSTECIKKNTVVAGVELLSEKLESYQFSKDAKDCLNGAFFIQDDYKINARFSLQAGARVDYTNSNSKIHLAPKFSFMYKAGANRGVAIRGGYSGGYRIPTLKELYTEWDHQGMFILVGNKDLKPEKSHNVQGGVEFTQKGVNLSVNGFYNYIYDKISTVWNIAQDSSFYANIDNATIYGIDANVRVEPFKDFLIKGGYAYVNDRELVDGYNVSATRPHSATIRFEYKIKKRSSDFTIGLNGKWLSGVNTWSKDGAGVYEKRHYNAYQIWKLNCVARFKRGIRANIGVNNIFNYKPNVVTYNAGITRGITVFAGLSLSLEEIFEK